MALERLYGPAVRLYLASPLAFADWQNPTVLELNANPDNDPDGLIFNLTCALDQDGSTFDLGDSETDDSLSFCQVAGSESPTAYNPEIVYSLFRSTVPWVESDASTLNTSNLGFSLMAWRGVEYFAIASVGEAHDAPFASGDRVKMARVVTDFGVDEIGSGENVKLNQTFGFRSDLNWNYELA